MPAAEPSRPAYVPVAPPANTEALPDRIARLVQQNQLAAMAGAFALGVVLGVLARR